MIIHSPIFSGSITQSDTAYANLSGSFSGSFTGIGNFTGLEADSVEFANVLNKPTLISGSSQVDADSVTNFDVNVLAYINTLGVLTGSSQIDGTGITNNSITIAGTSVSLGSSISLATITAGSEIVSSSTQLHDAFDTRYLNTEGDGIVSASNQISNYGIFAELDGDNLVSGSSQIDGTAITNNTITIVGNSTPLGGSISLSQITNGSNLVSGSSQIDVTATTNYSSIDQYSDTKVKTKLNAENVISSSAQLYNDLDSRYGNELGDGIVSSSAQISAYNTFLEINGDGVISGSSQVVLNNADKTGFDTADVAENASYLYYTDARVKTKLNAETVISSSAQITITESQISDLDHYTDTDFDNRLATKSTSNLSEGSNLYYTDARVKTKLNTETAVSGAAQILTLVSIDEDAMTSNSATKLPTQQSVKAYVDTKVSALVDSAPGTLDTLNELAAALGDDANFSTTVTNSIATKANSSVQIIAGDGLTGGGDLTASRTLNIGAGTGVTVSADSISIGQPVGTGDTVQFAKVGVGGASDATYELKVTGDIGATGDIVAYVSSDERLKNNVELISNPIEKVQSLKGVTWEWNELASEAAKQSPSVGVIAQDVEKVLPQLVHDRENGFKGVDYAKLTGLLIEAIKEQQKQIDELKNKLA